MVLLFCFCTGTVVSTSQNLQMYHITGTIHTVYTQRFELWSTHM